VSALPAAEALDAAAIARLVTGTEGAPFDLLGPHAVTLDGGIAGVSVRAWLPGARAATLVVGKARTEMRRVHDAGLFEVTIASKNPRPAYHYEVDLASPGREEPLLVTRRDPYAFAPLLGELDLHLLNEGTHLGLARTLGAHERAVDGVAGVAFAVWAPNARRLSVVGNFNRWDPAAHPMRFRESPGVW